MSHTVTEGHQKLAAYLVPITHEAQGLTNAMDKLCTDLLAGDTTDEQVDELHERCQSVEQHLKNLRRALRPPAQLEPAPLTDVGDSGAR